MAESPYPPYIPLRTIVWGRELALETTRPLRVETRTTASRALVWRETAEGFFPSGEVRTPSTGEEAVIEVPVTDLTGWVDPVTGDALDPTVGPTHTYTTRVRVLDGERLIQEYTVGPYVVPAGAAPIDGELLRHAGLAPSSAVPTTTWTLPDTDPIPANAVAGQFTLDPETGQLSLIKEI